MTSKQPPCVVPLDSAPVIPAEEAPTKARIARLVTREGCGSNLLLGACWMDPGERTNLWSFEEEDRTAAGDTGVYGWSGGGGLRARPHASRLPSTTMVVPVT